MRIEIELKDFTPVLDSLVQEYSLVTAAIYGIVWRYAQMSDKVCKAPLEKIGKRLDLSGKTAERHIKILCNDGYLVDLAPDLRNKPHTYVITGKAELAGTIAAHTDRESDRGKTESRTRSDRESDRGKTESPLKIHTKKDNKDNNGSAKKTSEKQTLNALADQMAQVCQVDVSTAGPKVRTGLKKMTIILSAKPNITQKLESFPAWWYANDWRGKRGQPPTPWEIGDTWGQFEADKVGPANGAATGPVLTDAKKKRLAELTAQFSKTK